MGKYEPGRAPQTGPPLFAPCDLELRKSNSSSIEDSSVNGYESLASRTYAHIRTGRGGGSYAFVGSKLRLGVTPFPPEDMKSVGEVYRILSEIGFKFSRDNLAGRDFKTKKTPVLDDQGTGVNK